MKNLVFSMIVSCALVVCAQRGPMPMHGGPGFGHGPAPMHHHHDSFWGRGGSHFWPGFIGGVIGGSLFAPPPPAPVVVAPAPVATVPVVVQQPVVTTPVVVQPAPVVYTVR